MEFVKAQPVKIRDIFGGEIFVQNLLAEDPSLLGLGDLYLRGKERVQERSARLDLLFESSDGESWYEVEVQLGRTDETHIIRTLEYWDNERRHHPEKKHFAVIVAEQINQRFFNVISLFNRYVPIVAIQMTAFEIAGNYTISFTRVLDHSANNQTLAEDAELEVADRTYWVRRTSEQTTKIIDDIFDLVRSFDPIASLKYNRVYVVVKRGASNFITIKPRKKEIGVSVIAPRVAHFDEQLSRERIEFEYVDDQGKYKFRFPEASYGQLRESINKAIQLAYSAEDSSPEDSLVEAEV